jgi:hypothetical protein
MANKGDILELVLKLFGVYLLFGFLSAIPMAILSISSTPFSEHIINKSLYYSLYASFPLLYLIFSMLLIFKGTAISKFLAGKQTSQDLSPSGEIPLHNRLSFWIILIGIFYFVNSAEGIVLASFKFTHTQLNPFLWSDFITKTIKLILSLILIFKSTSIENLISRKSK